MSFIHLGRVRIASRPQSVDVSFFDNGAPPPVLPALTAQEEAESLAVWRRARKRRAKEAQTSRGLVSLGLYAGALIALSHMDRAVESWATPQEDGGGGAPPDRPGEVAAADGTPTPLPLSVGLAWIVSPDGVTEAPMGTGASITWPVRAAPGSSTSSEMLVRLESGAIPVLASAEAARLEVAPTASPAADVIRASAPVTTTEAAIMLPTEARMPATAKAQPVTEARAAPRDAATTAQPAQAEAQPAQKAVPVTETVVASAVPTPSQAVTVSVESVETKPVWTAPVVTVEVTPVTVMPEQIVIRSEPAAVIQIAQPVPTITEKQELGAQAEKAGQHPAKAAPEAVAESVKETPGHAKSAEVEVAAPSPAHRQPAAVEATVPVAADGASVVVEAGAGSASHGRPAAGVEVTLPSVANGTPAQVEVAAATPETTGRPAVVEVTLPSVANGRPAQVEVAAATPDVGRPVAVEASVGVEVPKLGDILTGLLNPGQGRREDAKGPEATPATDSGQGKGNAGPAGAKVEEARAEASATVPPGPAVDAPGRSGSAPGRQDDATAVTVVVADAATPVATGPATPASAPAPAAEAGRPETPPGQQAKDAPPVTTAEAAPTPVAEAAKPDTPPGQQAKDAPPVTAAEARPSQPAVQTAEADGPGAKATPAANRAAEPETGPVKAEPAAAGGKGKAQAEEPEDVEAALLIAADTGKAPESRRAQKDAIDDFGPLPEAVPVADPEPTIPPITSDLIL